MLELEISKILIKLRNLKKCISQDRRAIKVQKVVRSDQSLFSINVIPGAVEIFSSAAGH